MVLGFILRTFLWTCDKKCTGLKFDRHSLSLKPFRQIFALLPGLTWEEYGILARFIDDNRPTLARIRDKPSQLCLTFLVKLREDPNYTD